MLRLTKVEDRFQIAGRGLVVVPGPLFSEFPVGGDFEAELRHPDGTVVSARVTLQAILQTPPPPSHIARRWGCMVVGVSKVEIPVGTEVWASYPTDNT